MGTSSRHIITLLHPVGYTDCPDGKTDASE